MIRWVVVCALATACAGDCESACRRVDTCAVALGAPGYTLAECQQQCGRQDELYQRWEDEEKQAAFQAHLTCVTGATCDELADGLCYDDLIFGFDQEL